MKAKVATCQAANSDTKVYKWDKLIERDERETA